MTTDSAQSYFVYVGTYTRGPSEGIYVCTMDGESGALEVIGSAGGVNNPSFVAIHPTNTSLYAANELGEPDDPRAGSVAAYSIDRQSGALAKINDARSRGSGPCHLTVDASGSFVLVANYQSGSIATLPVQAGGGVGDASNFVQHEGSSVIPERQSRPHAHSINLDAANRHAIAADLGLDQVIVYRFDPARGSLAPVEELTYKAPPGAGPRHFDFHPNGRFAYLINEIGSTLTAFAYDPATGGLTELQTESTLPTSFTGTSHTADVHVSPSGRFVYGSNRGHDSITIFAIDPQTGRMRFVGWESTRGKTPRNFAIDPSGRFLYAANENSDTIVAFRVDADTGKLEATGDVTEIPSPVCLQFSPRV